MAERRDSIDLLRGAVMVLMALDHARDFFHFGPSPTDHAETTPALFATRWITHFCAPVFVFLAGVGTSLQLARGSTKGELSRWLLGRGLWLVFLELTWMHLAWTLDFRFEFRLNLVQVLWAIGWSMVVLAGLVHLPTWAVGGIALAMIAGHNAFDGVHNDRWWWYVLHEEGRIRLGGGRSLFVSYPLVPWIGVMAAGYALGPHLSRRVLLALGAGAVALFVALRLPNLYGDPRPWSPQSSPLFTVFSFVNCEKYPPSLLYLLMTLGPAMLALAALDRVRASPRNPLLVFGRVPLFFYLVHLHLIVLAAIACHYAKVGDALFEIDPRDLPPDFGFPLWAAYLAAAGVVLALYPACRWYGRLKAARPRSLLRFV